LKICGVTILRNVASLGYPFVESLRSLLPLVDELVVNVGDDATWEAVEALGDPRIHPFRSSWSGRFSGGELLSQETNRALERCSGDWAVYLQADEVIHEDDLPAIRDALRHHLPRRTEGLLFRYHHFWRHYDVVADCWASFYPRAVRAVKLGIGVESAGDAAGFLRRSGGRTRGLIKADSGAHIFHYGWCNPAPVQFARARNLTTTFYSSELPAQLSADHMFGEMPVRRFRGTHPGPMRARVIAPSLESAGDVCQSIWPASLRALGRMARAPRAAARGWARPILPVTLTNAWWIATDALSSPRRSAPLRQ
jgi:hypothetical protein